MNTLKTRVAWLLALAITALSCVRATTRPATAPNARSSTRGTRARRVAGRTHHARWAEPPDPGIVRAAIPYGPTRQEETRVYARRHYGLDGIEIDPRAIVLHYTCSGTFRSVWTTFANNRKWKLEPPGVCAHYVIDQNGTIYELVPPTLFCKHATGVDHVAIGIEFVQRCMRGGPREADRMILERPLQLQAGLALVHRLRWQFDIPIENVIGHSMAWRSPLYHDLLGRRSDHSDWLESDVMEFRRRLPTP